MYIHRPHQISTIHDVTALKSEKYMKTQIQMGFGIGMTIVYKDGLSRASEADDMHSRDSKP